MYGNAAPFGDKAGDGIGRRGFTTLGQEGEQTAFAIHQHPAFIGLGAAFAHDIGFGEFGGGFFRPHQLIGGIADGARRDFAVTQGQIQIIEFGIAQGFAQML